MKVDYKYTEFNSKKLYYAQVGTGKQVTIFLLGWLSNIDKFPIEKLVSPYSKELRKHKLIFLHLSNHYKSDFTNKPYTVDLYTKELEAFCKTHNFNRINIVGHSAGGRYAINYASKNTNVVNKLVLVSSAGLSRKKASKTQLAKVKYYFHKFTNLNHDQEKILKQTFENVYGTNLKEKLKDITCPTLILWGTKDKTTPYKRARILTTNIKYNIHYPIKNKGHMIIKDPNTFFYLINFITQDYEVTNNLIKLSKNTKLTKELKKYKYNYLRINPSYKARKLFVLFINKKTIKQINKEYLQIENSLSKLSKHMLDTNDIRLKEILNLNGINFFKTKNTVENQLYNYARIDSIFNNKGFELVEFNARRPQMFEDVDWFNEYFKSYGIIDQPKHELTDAIINSIDCQCKTKGTTPNNILLISNFDKRSRYSFYARLKTKFRRAKIHKWDTKKSAEKIHESTLMDNKLFINDQKIDLIVVQSLGVGKSSFFYNNGKIINNNVKKAYFTGNLQISSPLSSSVFGRKQSLELLQNKKVQKLLNLTKNEITAIKNLPRSKNFNSVKQLNPKHVVKIQGLGSGKGVYFYNDISKKEKQKLKKLLNKGKHNILLQEKINLDPIVIYNLKTLKPLKAAVSLEPFIVNINGKPKIVDYTVRATPMKYVKENTKFNPVFNKPHIWFGGVVEY